MGLNIISVIKLDDSLELFYNNGEKSDFVITTSVFDILSETEILIHNPLKNGKLFLIPMDINIQVTAYRQDYGAIIFDVRLDKRMKVGNIYVIKCTLISEIRKKQRRHFYRVKLYREIVIRYLTDKNDIPLDYYVFDPDAIECNEIESKVSTLDISGGGFGFRSKIPFELGTYIYFKLDFFNLKREIYGRVVRCFESSKYENEYEMGIKFLELPNEFVRKITSYVFSSQQKLRRKE